MSTHHHTLKSPLEVNDEDHVRGPKTALVTLLEYGDYECPHCGAAHPVVEAVRREMGTRLRFVFRHFPFSANPCACGERGGIGGSSRGAR